MPAIGKCPYCESVLTYIEATDVDLTVTHQPQWKGMAYLCPACSKVLSVGVNPLLVRTEIVAQVEELLKKYLSR